MSVQNPQLAGFLLTGNRSNFLYVEGSTAWLYDCPHYLSPLYKADQCFDKIPIYHKDTKMYVHLITRQTFNYATPIECGNIRQNIIELDTDSDDTDFYILTPEPLKKEAPQMFKPTQIKTPMGPNTFTAQDAGIYSNAELDQFWNRVLFAKHSDTTLKLLGRALTYDFIKRTTVKMTMENLHRTHTINYVLDFMINIMKFNSIIYIRMVFRHLYSNFWISVLSFNSMWNLFSTFMFLHTVISFLIKALKSITIKYNLKNNISIVASLTHGFCDVVTSEMITDLNNDGKVKEQSNQLKRNKHYPDEMIESTFSLDKQESDNEFSRTSSPPPRYSKYQVFFNS